MTSSIYFRQATSQDDFATFSVFIAAIQDFSQRTGVMALTGGNDPETLKHLWERRRPLWEHLTNTCDQYWLAELNEKVVGYARSIVRDGHRVLTEFFVSPGNQSRGVGRELLKRAFPNDTPHRSIIATPDLRALSRYLKTGVYPFLTELYFERSPEYKTLDTDLTFERIGNTEAAIQATAEIDTAILGYRRPIDHSFLLTDRTGYLFKRHGKVIGYGYLNKEYYGPFALLNKEDFPAALIFSENQAVELGASRIGFETPVVNTLAVDHLTRRGYRLEGFMGSIMSNKPFGKFENYILSSPPFFI